MVTTLDDIAQISSSYLWQWPIFAAKWKGFLTFWSCHSLLDVSHQPEISFASWFFNSYCVTTSFAQLRKSLLVLTSITGVSSQTDLTSAIQFQMLLKESRFATETQSMKQSALLQLIILNLFRLESPDVSCIVSQRGFWLNIMEKCWQCSVPFCGVHVLKVQEQ